MLQKAEKQTIGPNATCNYLDKYGIPALIISISRAGTTHTRDTLSILGSGYTILNVTGLGDEVAVAVQQANPKFGLQEGVAITDPGPFQGDVLGLDIYVGFVRIELNRVRQEDRATTDATGGFRESTEHAAPPDVSEGHSRRRAGAPRVRLLAPQPG